MAHSPYTQQQLDSFSDLELNDQLEIEQSTLDGANADNEMSEAEVYVERIRQLKREIRNRNRFSNIDAGLSKLD